VTPDLSKNLINGKWVEAKTRQTMPSTNPASGEVLGVVPKSGPEDITAAVEAAKSAFEPWRKYPAPRRAEILFRAAEMLVKEKENLARLMTQEMGKVLAETRGDGQEAIDMTYFIVGDALVEHPDVAIISFTGSTETGLAISAKCARRGKRVSLEMGGKNAAIVMDDADLDLATDALTWSAFGTTGQRCTACSRIITHQPVRADLTARLVERARRLRLGDGLDPKTEVGPVVSDTQLQRVHEYVEVGKKEGARVLVGGRRTDEGPLGRGSFYAPTIFDNVTPGMRIAKEEIFGPVTDLIEAKSFEEAVRILNNVEYGL